MNRKLREISSDELKQIELDILKDVAKFCDAHGLRYFLAYGTLLGAVRHKGFIPWDDDIDIMMPYKDYQQFIKGYSHQYYYVNSIEKDLSYPLLFAKVFDKRTCCNMVSDDSPHVWIDIFPVMGLPANKLLEKVYIKNSLRLRSIWLNITITSGENIEERAEYYKKFRVVLAKCLKAIIPSGLLANIITHHLGGFDYVQSEQCINIGKLEYSIFYSKYFHESTEIEFEGNFFKAPAEYDNYLHMAYGDYMTLPPENQRITHSIEAFWKD